MTPRAVWTIGAPVLLSFCALATLHTSAPLYLAHQGFPLDDAWIHAVYARELARSGLLAFNPGLPATGETSPLWALLLAGGHAVARQPATAVLLTKALGFALHLLTAVLIARAIWRSGIEVVPLAWLAGSVIALHPDLVAASVSGMEVPLATVLMAGAVVASVRMAPAILAMVSAACVLGRPEAACFAVAFPCLLWARTRPASAWRLSAAAAGGAVLALALTAIRNLAVSGRPLPATFYAKANVASPFDLAWQLLGFRAVLGQMPLAAPILLLAGAAMSAVILVRGSARPAERTGAALFLSGTAFCVVSFTLVRPVDPAAFYHQRYVLPALLPIIASLPLLAHEVLATVRFRGRTVVESAVFGVMLAALVMASPARYRRLANDARNIDDVQVAFGRALAAAPPSANAWVIDAGASRFFGRAFVVDLMGLNSPEMLTADAQAFLDRHPPAYIDLFSGWSSVEGQSVQAMPIRSFVTTTPYTVTSFPTMRRHGLVTCEPPGAVGRIAVRQRVFTFRCGT